MTKTKAVLAGSAAVAVLATGGVAAAATSTPSTTAGHGHRGSHHRDSTRIEHGQFVEKDKAGAQVTHDIVNGAVTAVSASSISVKDGTGATTTFVVGSATRVHEKGQAKGSKGTIAGVKTGDQVTVLGNGTGPYDATFVATH